MPDISHPVLFSESMQVIISAKLADAKFTHTKWLDDELKTIRTHVRRHYKSQQIGKCAYCRKDLSLRSVANCHVEHILPKSLYRDFIFEPKNLCVVCADCNEIKENQDAIAPINPAKGSRVRRRYPRSSGAFQIVHPHFDCYDDHVLILQGHFYVDKTPKGHFTIGVCRLNRRLHHFGWDGDYTRSGAAMTAASGVVNAQTKAQMLAAIDQLKGALDSL